MNHPRNDRSRAGLHPRELRNPGIALIGDLSDKQMLSVVLNALPVSLFWKDCNSRILGCNQKFAEDSGALHPAELIGKTNFDFYPVEQADAYRADDLEVMTSGRPKLGIEESLLLPTGKTVWIETNKVPMRNTAGQVIGVLGTYRDVTERRQAGNERARFALELAVAKQAATMAMQDPLTGLPNRRALQDRLDSTLSSARPEERFAIVALDLDRFKAINDLYGHAVGDELLQKVGNLLTIELGEEALVARVGGDEFILHLKITSDAFLIEKLSALIAKFDVPINLTEHEVLIGVTLGVAITPEHGIDPALLIRRADMALYRAKEGGRARFSFFEPGMETDAQERAVLERDLRIAISNDEIVPYFQPQANLGTGQIQSYEISARWPHAKRGLVEDIQFSRLAEDIGLIGAVTMNLLRRGCSVIMHWPGAPRISINISPVLLRDATFPQKLMEILSKSGFPPARLEIEITAEALASDIDGAQNILASLRKLGVKIALDDFGSGYSSIQQLRRLPLDILNIDRSFAQSMNDGGEALMIVAAVIQLAKSLGLSVTAKGIETESEALALRALGCERGQGPYVGVPFPSTRKGHSSEKTAVGAW